MASSVYYSVAHRTNGYHNGRLNNGLPTYSSVVEEKRHRTAHLLPWLIPVSFRIPYVRRRQLRIPVPNYARLYQFFVSRFGRKRGSLVLFFAFLAMIFTTFALAKRFGTEDREWPKLSTGDPPTLVFRRADLQRIWQWEVASGHYPSRQNIPEQLGLKTALENPALPPRRQTVPSRFRAPPGPISTTTNGIGSKRIYLDIQSQPPNVNYPPRPVPGSVADLDIVMEHCDFSQKKFVRDCLEVLRLGGGLDNGNRLRRGKMDDWKYIYVEHAEGSNSTHYPSPTTIGPESPMDGITLAEPSGGPDVGLLKKRNAEWEPHLRLRPPLQHRPYSTLPNPCDDDSPRVYHMFWTGPFTDKPYLALLSFLFTQNVGLHLKEPPEESRVCRPKFWLWINPGPAAAVPNPSATRDMFQELESNPWASPFLHPRFKDVIEFKLWNTTEQLDGVPEIKEEWRSMETLFNSGGHAITVPPSKQKELGQSHATSANSTAQNHSGDEDDILNRTGSTSSDTYDRLSVILSDLARFVLCHRFGGIYLDADTILLRDWEELWGWKGAFTYRWSRLEKYNTAVLHLNKGSALGTFLFRTALKNNLDFHPWTVSSYTKDAHLEGLLLRLPDALFDSAWLSTENFQRERPPQPFFYEFSEFFETPQQSSAAPQAMGFDGFFKGAYSYHFHNSWWKPFDPARNWPDLGERFMDGELIARAAATATSMPATSEAVIRKRTLTPAEQEDTVEADQRDLGWATVLKRTFEAYIRGERPNMYGEWITW